MEVHNLFNFLFSFSDNFIFSLWNNDVTETESYSSMGWIMEAKFFEIVQELCGFPLSHGIIAKHSQVVDFTFIKYTVLKAYFFRYYLVKDNSTNSSNDVIILYLHSNPGVEI